jgi:hypothetical protein
MAWCSSARSTLPQGFRLRLALLQASLLRGALAPWLPALRRRSLLRLLGPWRLASSLE